MAFTGKKYVDLTGLGTFRDSLKTKLSNNSISVWSVNYANSATKDGSGNIITNTYATKTELGDINSVLDAINGEVI